MQHNIYEANKTRNNFLQHTFQNSEWVKVPHCFVFIDIYGWKLSFMIHSFCACIKVSHFMNPVLCMYMYAYSGVLLHKLHTYTQRCYGLSFLLNDLLYSNLLFYYLLFYNLVFYYLLLPTLHFTHYYIYWACTAHTRMNL